VHYKVEANAYGPTRVWAVIVIDDDWLAVHEIQDLKGVWTPVGTPTYEPQHENVLGKPTERQKRRGNIDAHRSRIHAALADAFELDEALEGHGDMRELLAGKFGITAPRSRRGRTRQVDAGEIERLKKEGLSDAEIADRLGVHPKTPANVRHKQRGRTPW
jgi:hypothetical protein